MQCGQLRRLELTECRLDVARMMPAVVALPHLEAFGLAGNDLDPEGACALAPALEKMVRLKELKCAANAAHQPTPAHTSPAALAASTTTDSGQTGRVRLHRRSRRWWG